MKNQPRLSLSPEDDTARETDLLSKELLLLLHRLQTSPPEDTAALSKALDPLMDRILICRTYGQAPATFYEPPEREHLFNQTVNAAVLAHLEQDYETPEDFPENITINRFRRMVPTAPDYRHPNHLSPLSDLLERLDEEHLSPDDQATTPTEAMTRAEAQMVETVLLEYNPYWYEATTQLKINVRSWLAQHQPDMLPMRSFTTSVCSHCLRIRGTQEMRSCSACRRRGCSRCWRRAEGDPSPWPRHSFITRGCGFRLSDQAEHRKNLNAGELDHLHLGWGFRSEGPVHAE